MRLAMFAEAEASLRHIGVEQRLDHLHNRLLHDAIGYNGDPEGPTLFRVG